MAANPTLIGIVTFGNLNFTILTIRSIIETTRSPIGFVVIVAKPGDGPTASWLAVNKIPSIVHATNRGFPASINDIYDVAWKHGVFGNLILAGNDIVPYPGAIDALIEQASTSDYEWIAASMFDVQSLIQHYPEQAKHFEGPSLNFSDWRASGEPMFRPWEIHNEIVAQTDRAIETNPEGPSLIKDVRNLCLFKRSVFDKLGYADVNFWPGGYFEDNDYARRAVNAGIKSCALTHSQYFHFWSRTIHQASGAGEAMPQGKRDHHFALNEIYYRQKWGGSFGHEKFKVPFNVQPELPSALKIADRVQEDSIIKHWSTL